MNFKGNNRNQGRDCYAQFIMIVNIYRYAMLLILIYVLVSTSIFRFRHPQLTETQLFTHIIDAFIFNKITPCNQPAN